MSLQGKARKAVKKAANSDSEEDMGVFDDASDGEWAQPAKPKARMLHAGTACSDCCCCCCYIAPLPNTSPACSCSGFLRAKVSIVA
jgi:hypothetical protein